MEEACGWPLEGCQWKKSGTLIECFTDDKKSVRQGQFFVVLVRMEVTNTTIASL